MWMQLYSQVSIRLASFVTLACLVCSPADGATRSQLSYWLSDTALAEIKTLASNHPRLLHRPMHISPRGTSALDEAITLTLRESLFRVQGLQVVVPATRSIQQPSAAASVDELDCHVESHWDNELQVAVIALEKGLVEVQLDLVDMAEPGVAFKSWRWRGSLNKSEWDYFDKPARLGGNDGSMDAPWVEGEFERAATLLSEQFACAMRPDIVDHAALQWPDQGAIPAPLSAAVSEIRRRLGYYREIGEAREHTDYRVRVDWQPVSDGVWQLTVRGTPTSDHLAGVMVATYIEARLSPGERYQAPRSLPATVPMQAPLPGEPASEYLHVELLDISQSDKGFSRAELRVRLRLSNGSDTPMDFGLSLSGGHYLQCIPESRYYRHDRYAYSEGRLSPGQSVVKVMEIDGARHNPNPLFGTPRCAGFQGLEGLEDFAREGHRVTQFVRWAL
jgi:hypothetical protein